jgi:tetratricopeptide (TPR) repeat protein
MRLWLLALLAVSTLWAADPRQLALELRAQSDYERVELASSPPLADTGRCIQSLAALLPVAPAAELPLIHFRWGYCTLAGADFTAAAAEFDKAIAAWRTASLNKKQPEEPAPSALLVLAAIARLKAGGDESALEDAGAAIAAALVHPSCASKLLPAEACEALMATGHEWLGWLDQRRDNLVAAAREFGQTSNTAWQQWIAGRRAFEDRRYAEAAAAEGRAAEEWERQRNQPAPSFIDGLRPRPDMGLAFTDWGAAQLLAGSAGAASATLDRAVQVAPAMARAYYLRGRAKELADRPEAALSDYNLASRTAFADAPDLASGEAHLYRGILFYRRKEYQRAEGEFSSALNLGIPAGLRADAEAWRSLAAVASGACEGSRESLGRALGSVSPFFPAREATAAMAACPATAAAPGPNPLR